jgi:CBS domain-containing protein
MHGSMELATPVARIMTPDPITIGPGARVSEARALLSARRVHHLPVVRGRELVGIVSTGDVRRYGPPPLFTSAAVVDARLDCYLVTEIMTADPVTVSPDDPIERALELLKLDSFSALPVVDGTDLVGNVTCADVLGYLMDVLRDPARWRFAQAGPA